jgi:hypothetical protein
MESELHHLSFASNVIFTFEYKEIDGIIDSLWLILLGGFGLKTAFYIKSKNVETISVGFKSSIQSYQLHPKSLIKIIKKFEMVKNMSNPNCII